MSTMLREDPLYEFDDFRWAGNCGSSEAGALTSNGYTRVTDRIIADLENGIRPWMKPWSSEHAAGRISRPLRHNGTPYRGMNILLLWGEAVAKGYAAPIWMTFKQAQELGAFVRKGEHGSLVVYANTITRSEKNGEGEDIEREIPFMRGYTVFNVEQIDGLPQHYYAQPVNPLPLSERIVNADRFMNGTGAAIQHGGNQAFYAPARDIVQLPPFEAFRDKESYYATALHELTHWTKHKSRLDRSFDANRFGDHGFVPERLRILLLGNPQRRRMLSNQLRLSTLYEGFSSSRRDQAFRH